MDQATPAPVLTAGGLVVPPVTVSLDYINSHDGSSTTLLLAESLLTNPVNTNSSQVFVPRIDSTSSNPSSNSWAKWTTPPQIINSVSTLLNVPTSGSEQFRSSGHG